MVTVSLLDDIFHFSSLFFRSDGNIMAKSFLAPHNKVFMGSVFSLTATGTCDHLPGSGIFFRQGILQKKNNVISQKKLFYSPIRAFRNLYISGFGRC